METVDFYPKTFQDIPDQDNPAFYGDECLMIVRSTHDFQKRHAIVLHIIPDPIESVNHVAVFWDHDKAVEYCKILPG